MLSDAHLRGGHCARAPPRQGCTHRNNLRIAHRACPQRNASRGGDRTDGAPLPAPVVENTGKAQKRTGAGRLQQRSKTLTKTGGSGLVVQEQIDSGVRVLGRATTPRAGEDALSPRRVCDRGTDYGRRAERTPEPTRGLAAAHCECRSHEAAIRRVARRRLRVRTARPGDVCGPELSGGGHPDRASAWGA